MPIPKDDLQASVDVFDTLEWVIVLYVGRRSETLRRRWAWIGVEKMEDGECSKGDCATDKEHLLRLKNYLFAGSHDSAQRAAVAYTILAACKTADINPLEYLADVLQKLPSRNVHEVDDLIPSQWAHYKKTFEG